MLRPLQMSGVELLSPSLWAEWRRRNSDVTIPLGIAALEQAGNLANLTRLIDGESKPHVGFPFSDTDVYKTLEAIAWTGQSAAPGLLGDFFASTVALLEKVQAPNGMLNSYIQRSPLRVPYDDLSESHELYTAGHLIQAAVADRRMTGNTALIGVALRVADHLFETFGDTRRTDYDGHPGVETALVELYRETGDRRFLELARQFVVHRGAQIFRNDPRGLGYFQDRKPIRHERQIVGHAVRATYLEAGVVDVAIETGDARLLESSLLRWHDMVTKKLYLTGGVGSRHKSEAFGDPYELPADRAYCETCAAIGSIHWSWRLLLATGESKYADLIERTVYNGLGAAISIDGRSFFYSNPLQVRADHEASDEEESGRRLPWYRCACCPPNLMRAFASLPHYVATTTDAGLQLHQFTSASVRTELVSGEVELDITTDYPASGTVDIVVRRSMPPRWVLSVRVPSWAAGGVRAWIDNDPVSLTPTPAGYLEFDREWKVGNRIAVELPVAPRITAGNPRIDGIRDCVAIEYGPLVYCVEEVDNPGADLADLSIDASIEPVSRPRAASTLPALVLAGSVPLRPADGALYQSAHEEQEGGVERGEVVAVPYMTWGNRAAGGMRVWLRRMRASP